MEPLIIEIHHNQKGWLEAASLIFLNKYEVEIEYDLDYAAEYLGRKDRFALSLTLPVDTQIYRGPFPGFVLDLMPQGEPLRRIMRRYSISHPEDYQKVLSDVPLASPGNMRIKQPWIAIEETRPQYLHQGFTKEDLVQRHIDFVDYMEQVGAPIGGTSGAAGGSPKFLLREDESGRLHAEGMLDDDKTRQAYLVKLPFTDSQNSIQLLHAEKCYYDFLRELPLITGEAIEISDHVLFIKRFDRIRDQHGRLCYHGLESLYSAHNINVHGAYLKHEDNLQLIKLHSSRVREDVAEYLKRDIVNKALANWDNHGRNTSFIKKDQEISLSPVYDVTAMRFFTGDFIVELTRWQQFNKNLPDRLDWIDQHIGVSKDFLKQELKVLYESLAGIKERLRNLGVPQDFIDRSQAERTMTIDELKATVL